MLICLVAGGVVLLTRRSHHESAVVKENVNTNVIAPPKHEPTTVKENAGIHFFPSKFDKRPERERIPLLVYGYLADARAKPIAERSTISCIATEGLDNLITVLAQHPVIGIEAMSPKNAPGEAGKAIAIYHTKYPKGLALYAPWTYNVMTAANRAIEYRAQGIIMPGIKSKEMLTYLIQVGQRTDKVSSCANHC